MHSSLGNKSQTVVSKKKSKMPVARGWGGGHRELVRVSRVQSLSFVVELNVCITTETAH